MYKVFLVDDEIVIREGIRNNFPWDGTEFVLCGEAPDGEIALSMIQELKPDILITDIRMPFMNGLALCKNAMRAMPWMHVVILSGYDDFAYAKEAISLGVKEYLLKPVSAEELEKVLLRIADMIRSERIQQADVEALKRQLVSSSRYMQGKLLSDLLDGLYAEELLAEARKLHMNLVAKCYAVMLVNASESDKLLTVQGAVQRLAARAGGTIHQAVRNGMLAVLVLGDTIDDLEERAYAFAQALKHEMERGGHASPSIAIGASVNQLKDLPQSLDAANSVLQTMAGYGKRIMSAADIRMEMPPALMSMEVVPLYEKLQYAAYQEAPAIVEAYFESLGGMAEQSLLIANYMIVDALLAGMRIIKQSGGDPNEVLPEALHQSSLLKSIKTHEDVLHTAKNILARSLAFRDAQSLSRYSEIIRKACAYIEENHQRPEITLHDVAGHVALSNNHFCTIFSQEMGITLIEYLTRLRMEKAKHFLKTTDLRSSEIAGQIGYNDAHYFGYLFKKHTGMSPRDYRNSCKKQPGGKS